MPIHLTPLSVTEGGEVIITSIMYECLLAESQNISNRDMRKDDFWIIITGNLFI